MVDNLPFTQVETAQSGLSEIILQSAGEGICVIDAAGRISFANRAALKMLGVGENEISGMPFDEALFGRKFGADEAAISPIVFTLDEGEDSRVGGDVFFRRGEGDFWVQYICVPLKNKDLVTGAVVTFQDISERRDLELALAAAHEAALEAARAKAAFLANMSHEIRTPLNGIIGAAHLLARTELSDRQKDFVRIMQSGSTLLLDLVNDILDFSKIEAGRLELEEYVFNLREVLNETIVFFARAAEKKGLVLNSRAADDLPNEFCGDGRRLRQILNNLIGNAVKFTEHGEITAKVRQIAERNGRATLEFTITDTGIGLSAADKARLFQPFTQADASTTRRFGGTGLGLAICRELVEMMNGDIDVSSRLGEGSTFVFTVKLRIAESSAPAAAVHISSAPNAADSSANVKSKILIAEDDEAGRTILAEILRLSGFTVETAADGAEAVDKWKREQFGVVLMDCRMPVMDGYEAAATIRSLEKNNPRTEIIAFTANYGEEERERCRRAGMNDFLTKPVDVAGLKRILTKAVSNGKDEGNLDLKENLGQDLAEFIEEKTLENFLKIEARGNRDFAREMLRIYLAHAEDLSNALRVAVKTDDRSTVREIAHRLRGSSGNVGLTGACALWRELEIAAETQSTPSLEEIVERLSVEHEKLSKLLSA